MCIVSLLPSATEMLTALDVEPIGVSHSCDYPPRVTERPTLTSTVVDYEDRSSGEIDEQMQSVDGAVYDLKGDQLEALDPDLIVTQATCEVCAVDASVVYETVSERGLDADILTLDPHSFEDTLTDIRRVGEAIGKKSEADELIARQQKRIETVRSRVAGLDRPRTAVLDWTDPLIRGGHWIKDLIGLAGGDNSFQPDGPSEPIRWETLREYDPERVIVAPCGFTRKRAREAVNELSRCPEWTDIAAVQSGSVYAVDGNALFNRPGPRLVESLEVLADCIHPDHAPTDGEQRD